MNSSFLHLQIDSMRNHQSMRCSILFGLHFFNLPSVPQSLNLLHAGHLRHPSRYTDLDFQHNRNSFGHPSLLLTLHRNLASDVIHRHTSNHRPWTDRHLDDPYRQIHTHRLTPDLPTEVVAASTCLCTCLCCHHYYGLVWPTFYWNSSCFDNHCSVGVPLIPDREPSSTHSRVEDRHRIPHSIIRRDLWHCPLDNLHHKQHCQVVFDVSFLTRWNPFMRNFYASIIFLSFVTHWFNLLCSYCSFCSCRVFICLRQNCSCHHLRCHHALHWGPHLESFHCHPSSSSFLCW